MKILLLPLICKKVQINPFIKDLYWKTSLNQETPLDAMQNASESYASDLDSI